jgi:alpha-L-fucosidase 2
MLLQSQEGYIEFLPSLPNEWKDGSFFGWCARGGAVVDAQWANAILNKVVIKATVDNTFKIKMPANVAKVEMLKKGKLVATQPADNFLLLRLTKGETAEIHFR